MRIALASIAFFLSGFAALIYQVVWQRMLVLPIGADVYSTTVIVGAFMAGLGVGSLARWSTPAGEERAAEILAILFQPEASGDYAM